MSETIFAANHLKESTVLAVIKNFQSTVERLTGGLKSKHFNSKFNVLFNLVLKS